MSIARTGNDDKDDCGLCLKFRLKKSENMLQ